MLGLESESENPENVQARSTIQARMNRSVGHLRYSLSRWPSGVSSDCCSMVLDTVRMASLTKSSHCSAGSEVYHIRRYWSRSQEKFSFASSNLSDPSSDWISCCAAASISKLCHEELIEGSKPTSMRLSGVPWPVDAAWMVATRSAKAAITSSLSLVRCFVVSNAAAMRLDAGRSVTLGVVSRPIC